MAKKAAQSKATIAKRKENIKIQKDELKLKFGNILDKKGSSLEGIIKDLNNGFKYKGLYFDADTGENIEIEKFMPPDKKGAADVILRLAAYLVPKPAQEQEEAIKIDIKPVEHVVRTEKEGKIIGKFLENTFKK